MINAVANRRFFSIGRVLRHVSEPRTSQLPQPDDIPQHPSPIGKTSEDTLLNGKVDSTDSNRNNSQLSDDQNDNKTADPEPTPNVIKMSLIQTKELKEKELPEYVPLSMFNAKPMNIPRLAYDLDRVLFSPGVHYMQDPRTKRFNFSEDLFEIPSLDRFKFDSIKPFVPSGKDPQMMKIAETVNEAYEEKSKLTKSPPTEEKSEITKSSSTKKGSKNRKKKRKEDKYKLNLYPQAAIKYFSSTSSMTGVLRHFHLLLSRNRPINTHNFSKSFPDQSQIAPSLKFASSSIVTPKNNKDPKSQIYSIDADKLGASEITLSLLGHELELFLTTGRQKFEQRHLTQDPFDSGREKLNTYEPPPESYHYAQMGKFLMRSQLDTYHKDLPGSKTFDLKTRAVCAIRYDILHTTFHPTNYTILKTHGPFESFEREMFDCATTTMLKYQLQARIGNMDGVFVCVHNIRKVFGFYYLSLNEMDHVLNGFDLESDKQLQLQSATANNNKDKELYDGEDAVERKNESGKVIKEKPLDSIVNNIGSHWQEKREVLSTYIARHQFNMSMKMWEDLLDQIHEVTGGKPYQLITEYKSKMAAENSDDVEIGHHIQVIVNVLSDTVLAQLDEEDKKVKEEHPTPPLPPMAKMRRGCFRHGKNMRNFRVISQRMYQQANGKNFMFIITADHFFDGKKSTMKHPTPPVDLIDENTHHTWDIKYQIRQVHDEQYIKKRFDKYVTQSIMTKFNPSFVDRMPVGSDVHLDKNASDKQRVLRAYSIRQRKRVLREGGNVKDLDSWR